MTDKTPPDHDQYEPAEGSGASFTRRRFVASGIATGAVIVWSSPFPFADSAIGQVIRTTNPTGPTGPTGAGGPTAGTGASGSSGPGTPTAASGPSGPAGQRPSKKHNDVIQILVAGNVLNQHHQHRRVFVLVNIGWTGHARLHATAVLEAIVGRGKHAKRTRLGTAHFTVGPRSHHRIGIDLSVDAVALLQTTRSLPVRLAVKGNGASAHRMLILRGSSRHVGADSSSGA